MSDSDSGSGRGSSSSGGSLPALSTLRRAMRWETFAVLGVLVLLAAVLS